MKNLEEELLSAHGRLTSLRVDQCSAGYLDPYFICMVCQRVVEQPKECA